MSPQAPARPCPRPGCASLQPCVTHARKPWQRYTPRREMGGSHWERSRIRARIFERDGHVCTIGAPGCRGLATEVDHVLAVTRGGDDSDANLRSVCSRCHRKKSANESRP